mmetsp:Transcript_30785/g.73908  ORF Transcript_30785/g.73908 Transcript_30785/m.73908 type:complete len:264 (-) Transcript_30785:2263-3054(-)
MREEGSSNLKVIDICAFSDCTSLLEVSLPSTVNILERSCFEKCTALKSVQVPILEGNLHEIRRFAFSQCTSLSSIQLPKSLRIIYRQAFKLCGSLRHLEIARLNDQQDDDVNNSFFQVVLPLIKSAMNPTLPPVLLNDKASYYGVPQEWRSEMLSILSKKDRDHDWKAAGGGRRVVTREKQQCMFFDLLGRMEGYRRVEITSLLELALWKKELLLQLAPNPNPNIMDRASCRFTCGAQVVMENVIGYLWDPISTTTCSIGSSF